MSWDKTSIKYLGILLPIDLSKLEEIIMALLKNNWNLIPYLNLSSRIESVKINILQRLL